MLAFSGIWALGQKKGPLALFRGALGEAKIFLKKFLLVISRT
jgi:hypothetical protein